MHNNNFKSILHTQSFYNREYNIKAIKNSKIFILISTLYRRKAFSHSLMSS